jgi:heptosyltransferase-1
MGDVIHALPAVGALRAAFPEATIGWVIEERWAELLCTLPTARSGPRSPQRPLADRIHTVNLKPWRRALHSPQTWEQVAAALSEIRGVKYQIAVDLQGAARSALIARWSGAETIYGAIQPRENVAAMFYSREVMTRGAHVVEQGISLVESVAGVALKAPEVQFPHDLAADEEAERKLQALGGDVVLLNPGAGWGAKQWPVERFAEVARSLSADGLQCLVNYGPGEEKLARELEAGSGGAARPVPCTITQLISITRRAKLFIGGDTGPLHLAAALRVPVVGIYGPTDPSRNGPFGTRAKVLRSASSITSHTRRPQTEQGLLEITAAQVTAAARELLEIPRG